ncbi:MAG: hypothetical protein NC223_10470 [Butyrivibrio sp.]|nr:hypothetical protein [Butyrivibrio sp.]
MKNPAGVYTARQKDGTVYYRSSITIRGRHISLGSFDTADKAGRACAEARLLYSSEQTIEDYSDSLALPFKKYVSLVNYRDNGIYFKTPVYIYSKYFTYFLSPSVSLKFDVDDLFYYSTRSIMQRGGHLFVADFGMQVNLLSRYGIREHAVRGRDYYFANGDACDYRYGNIIIINPYHGVRRFVKDGRDYYKVKIHINGDFAVGTYRSQTEAAIAYNKAADILRSKGCKKSFPENYPESLSASEYASIYDSVKISEKIREYVF